MYSTRLLQLYSFVAQTDNRLSARLAAVAGRDSTSMKILAFITTIFLPGSYVAVSSSAFVVSLQTLTDIDIIFYEHVNWEDTASDTVSPRFWIYWVVAGPLTLLTLGGWALWWSFEKNRYDAQLEETVKHANEIKTTPWWRRLLKSEDALGEEAQDAPVIISMSEGDRRGVVRDPPIESSRGRGGRRVTNLEAHLPEGDY
ncbi:hypothetical protein BJX64DRAFT_121334 [Aspergillus heterothallicus]